MRWIWPLSWYWRIQQLEADNARLTAQNRELDGRLRAAAIQQASLLAVYTSSLASVSAMVEQSSVEAYRVRVQASVLQDAEAFQQSRSDR